MHLKVKTKKKENLLAKISKAKDNLAVKVLNKKGYKCDNTQISQIKINTQLNLTRADILSQGFYSCAIIIYGNTI